MKKNLIIAVCGDESMHKVWLEGRENFDLMVVYYGDNGKKYERDGILYDQAKGTKFLIMHQMCERHMYFFENYDAILIPDDDLYITGKDWTRFFKLFHAYNMKLAQPSIIGWQCIPLSAHNPSYILRYTNWVEIMTPCFNQQTFKDVSNTFNENNTNWGIEYIWVKILGQPSTGIGIIDDVVALHTRPCFFGDTYWRNNNNCEKAIKEISSLSVKYDIDLDDLMVYGGVERDKFDYDNLGSEDKFFPANCQIMKELISSLRQKRCKTFI